MDGTKTLPDHRLPDNADRLGAMRGEKRVYKRKYRWGTLEICADFGEAGDYIFYRTGANEWDCSPFQAANAQHNPKQALSLVNGWLKSQAG